jgi:uncharacterized protein YjbI with pentapeptide repeats
LSGADLAGADLSGANLSNAILDGAKFARSKLVGANLSASRCVETNFNQANLSHCKLIGTIVGSFSYPIYNSNPIALDEMNSDAQYDANLVVKLMSLKIMKSNSLSSQTFFMRSLQERISAGLI